LASRVILPKLPISADITLFDGEKVRGEFFVSPSSPHHEGPETLLDLMNDNTRTFVPFQTEGGMMLLNRAAVRNIIFESSHLMSIFTSPDNDNIYGLTVYVRTEHKESELQGFCYTGDLRPEARRPVDLLNSPDMFLLIYCNERLVMFNKNAISHATV